MNFVSGGVVFKIQRLRVSWFLNPALLEGMYMDSDSPDAPDGAAWGLELLVVGTQCLGTHELG